MKSTDKKASAYTPIGDKQDKTKHIKQTSGDKQFDAAIDRLFKPVVQQAK